MRRRLWLAFVGAAALLLFPGAPSQARTSAKKAIWGPAYVNGVSQFPRYRDLGVTTYQTRLNWSAVAPTRPQQPRDPRDPAYQWPADVTRAVSDAGRYRMKVALMLIGAPPWANGGEPWNWAPQQEADFADFAYAASRRYPSVRLWMIWGEPSRGYNFAPFPYQAQPGRPLTPEQAGPPQRYARLLDAAYGALKAANPRNRVIGGMTYTGGDISAWQWITYMRLPDGRPPRLDLYGHNPFTWRFPNLRSRPACCGLSDFGDLLRLSRAVDRNLRQPHQGPIPLFLSEWTIPTGVDSEFNFHVDPRTQAAWIGAALRAVRSTSRIAALGWVHLYDERRRAGGQPVSHGGLLYANGRPKPGYFAFKSG